MSESALADVGLQGLKSGSEQNSLNNILSREQTEALWKTLPQTPGVEILAAPRVTTVNGHQAQVSVQSQMPFVNSSGESATVAVGPSVDIVPHLSADRTTVDMTVYATLSVPNSENVPTDPGPQPTAGQN